MKLLNRCGTCPACEVVLATRRQIFRLTSSLQHLGDDEIEVWNRTLAEYPCADPPTLDPGEPLGERVFRDAADRSIRARLAPMERRDAPGLRQGLRAVVFESEEGARLGQADLYHNVELRSLSIAELNDLLRQAT